MRGANAGDANKPSNMHLREMWSYAPTPSTLTTVADVLLSVATRIARASASVPARVERAY